MPYTLRPDAQFREAARSVKADGQNDAAAESLCLMQGQKMIILIGSHCKVRKVLSKSMSHWPVRIGSLDADLHVVLHLHAFTKSH